MYEIELPEISYKQFQFEIIGMKKEELQEKSISLGKALKERGRRIVTGKNLEDMTGDYKVYHF